MGGEYVKSLRGCREAANPTGIPAQPFETETKGERHARSLYQTYLAARLKHGKQPVIFINTGGDRYTIFDNDVYAAAQHCGLHVCTALHHRATVDQHAAAELQAAGYEIVYVTHQEQEGESDNGL